MTTRRLANAFLLVLWFSLSALTFAQDDQAARQAAVDRHFKAVPFAQMVDDILEEAGKQLPAEQRAQFAAGMKGLINMGILERASREALAKTLTVEEIDAMTEFYLSKHGASIMKKMPRYTAELMPIMMREMQAAAEALQRRASK